MSFPVYDFDRLEAIEELSKMRGFDKNFQLVYYNYWSDYDGSGWLALFERNGDFFQCEGGYSPEVGDVEDMLHYTPITLESALEEIDVMEEACSEMTRKHSR